MDNDLIKVPSARDHCPCAPDGWLGMIEMTGGRSGSGRTRRGKELINREKRSDSMLHRDVSEARR